VGGGGKESSEVVGNGEGMPRENWVTLSPIQKSTLKRYLFTHQL
jgi:hypothetical protein